MPMLPVHFFTIVLNGQPWIRYHIEMFRTLPFDWHWHIVEGAATLSHDTAWSVPSGGQLPEGVHRGGLSRDGTSEYLDRLAAEHPNRVSVYRKPSGEFWDGKREMVSAPMAAMPATCLLWQVDSDELWTAAQITRMRDMFLAHPDKRAAYFWCHFFVGPDLVVADRGTFGNNPAFEWLRVWRKGRFDRWLAHEPPILATAFEAVRARIRTPGRSGFDQVLPAGSKRVFSHDETAAAGLVFQHMSYVTEAQLLFKENYYGYRGALDGWRRLQSHDRVSRKLKDYFPWVTDDATVERASARGIVPLMVP